MPQHNNQTNDRCLLDVELEFEAVRDSQSPRLLRARYNKREVSVDELLQVRRDIERYCSPVFFAQYQRFTAKPETLIAGIQEDADKAARFHALLFFDYYARHNLWEMADNRLAWEKALTELMKEVNTGWMQSELQRMDERLTRRRALGPAPICDIGAYTSLQDS